MLSRKRIWSPRHASFLFLLFVSFFFVFSFLFFFLFFSFFLFLFFFLYMDIYFFFVICLQRIILDKSRGGEKSVRICVRETQWSEKSRTNLAECSLTYRGAINLASKIPGLILAFPPYTLVFLPLPPSRPRDIIVLYAFRCPPVMRKSGLYNIRYRVLSGIPALIKISQSVALSGSIVSWKLRDSHSYNQFPGSIAKWRDKFETGIVYGE